MDALAISMACCDLDLWPLESNQVISSASFTKTVQTTEQTNTWTESIMPVPTLSYSKGIKYYMLVISHMHLNMSNILDLTPAIRIITVCRRARQVIVAGICRHRL